MERTGADLDLFRRTVVDELAAVDPGHQRRIERQDAVESQHMGYEIVSEHRQPTQVAATNHPGPGQVRGGDLCSFQKWNRDPVVPRAVGKTWPSAESRCQLHGRPTGGTGHSAEAAVEPLGDSIASRLSQ